MRLKHLYIKDYKNLKDFSLDFENGNGLSILIGNNGSGKSNVLGLYSGEDLRLWENFYLQRYLEYLTSVYRRGFTGKMGMYYVNKFLWNIALFVMLLFKE